jgi:hypothetical protein
MQKFKLLIPNVKTDQLFFDTYEAAEFQAKTMLKNYAFRFVSLFNDNKLVTVFIKPGYSIFNFKAFKALEHAGQIADYFILNHEGHENYYIKLKSKKA